jgi:class 3 adenylate cyclase/tetratricopeptide (TPR) repeat protein
VTCPRCGRTPRYDARFCEQCGAALDATATIYTPRHLAEKVLVTRAALQGERKRVTVLFCDIASSTRLAERIGADAMHALLNRFFELAMAEIHRYEGTINQFLGDGFMALFGAPIAHEDHARRAVLAAFGVRRALATDPHMAELRTRMGLNTGAVVVGAIGDNLRMDYTAIGDTTNLAARLQQIAGPGDIYLSEATYRLVDRYVDCARLGGRALKGKAAAVVVYELGAERKHPAPETENSRSIASPLVGRDQELAELTDCLARLGAGEGGIVGVVGEPGLGKSRLMSEVSRVAADGSLLWLEGRSLSFGQTLSYWPFLEIIRRWAGIGEGDGDAAALAKLEASTRALLAADAGEVVPYLATLLSLPVEPEYERSVKYLDGQAMGRQIFRSIRRLVDRLASMQPLVLVFEDLHWADQSSTELIEHLLPLVNTARLLLCGVGRPERDSPASRLRELARAEYAGRYHEIVLTALPPDSSAALVENIVADDQMPPQLKALILEKSDGNPFFIEEVLRSMIATRTLTWDPAAATWRVTREVDRISIPDTLHGVIMARVDRLDDDVKDVLKVASVIGRSFLYRVLRAVSAAARNLDGQLAELQQLELVREKRRVPELEYFFKHALVQEATYESILLERRRALHRQIATCIEQLWGDRVEAAYGLLAYHHAQAEDWEKAQSYLFKAADQAGGIAADAEALALYRDALRAYERAFGDRWTPFERAVLDRKIGEALLRRGQHDEALGYLERAVGTLRGAPYPRARAGVRGLIVRELLRTIGHRILPWTAARTGGAAVSPVAEELLHLTESLGWIYLMTDQERFLMDTLSALNFFERHFHPVGLAYQYTSIAMTCGLLGAFRLGRYYHRRAMALADTIKDPRAEALAHAGIGLHEEFLAHFTDAIAHYRRSITTYRTLGHLRGMGAAAGRLGVVLHNLGDFEGARALAEDVTRWGTEASDRQVVAWGVALLGWVNLRTGHIPDAVDNSARAAAIAKGVPDYVGVASSGALLGWCRVRHGELERGMADLEEAMRVRTTRRLQGGLVSHVTLMHAEGTLAVADQATGDERRVMLRRARRAVKAAMRETKRYRGLVAMGFRLRGTLAWLAGDQEAAKRAWRASLSAANEMKLPYEAGLTRLEAARRTHNADELSRADAIFAGIGARPPSH